MSNKIGINMKVHITGRQLSQATTIEIQNSRNEINISKECKKMESEQKFKKFKK